jgi:hypothetical protein
MNQAPRNEVPTECEAKELAAEREEGLMDTERFTMLTQQYPQEFQALKARQMPVGSFNNIYGEELLGTFYERIRGAGYHPEADCLGAAIELRRPVGYGGMDGSPERVRFFVDWEGDGRFTAAAPMPGEVGFCAFDNGDVERTPVAYLVCTHGLVRPQNLRPRSAYRLRVILSWRDPITGPDFMPRWGDRQDYLIQIDPPTS